MQSSNRRTGRLCNPQMKGQEDFIQALYFLANNAIEQDCSRANTLLLQLHPMKRTVKVISKKVHWVPWKGAGYFTESGTSSKLSQWYQQDSHKRIWESIKEVRNFTRCQLFNSPVWPMREISDDAAMASLPRRSKRSSRGSLWPLGKATVWHLLSHPTPADKPNSRRVRPKGTSCAQSFTAAQKASILIQAWESCSAWWQVSKEKKKSFCRNWSYYQRDPTAISTVRHGAAD